MYIRMYFGYALLEYETKQLSKGQKIITKKS